MFALDYKSHKSIYEQVIDKIKELIVTGVLKKNEKLPSVRELSKSLTVNPNTIAKAFKELEREGFIYTVSGRGSFVAERSSIQKNPEKVERILTRMINDYKELLYLGLDYSGATSLLLSAIEEVKKGESK